MKTPNQRGFPELHHYPESELLPKCITILLKPALPPQISLTPQPPTAHLLTPQLLDLSLTFLLGPAQGHHLLLCHCQPLPRCTQLLCQPHNKWGVMGMEGSQYPELREK